MYKSNGFYWRHDEIDEFKSKLETLSRDYDRLKKQLYDRDEEYVKLADDFERLKNQNTSHQSILNQIRKLSEKIDDVLLFKERLPSPSHSNPEYY